MDDLISRQQAIATAVSAAIDWHRLANPQYSIAYSIGEAMNSLPSAQPGWIPCSTELPKDEEEVIVSIHDDSGDYACDYTSFGWYAAAGEFWVVDNEASMRVVAWMPLPTPYREGGQDE